MFFFNLMAIAPHQHKLLAGGEETSRVWSPSGNFPSRPSLLVWKSLGLFPSGKMSPYSEISLVSRRFFGRGDEQQAEPLHLCCALLQLLLCASSFSRGLLQNSQGTGGSPTLSIFHMIQGVATKTKKRAIIVFCGASGAAWTGVSHPRYHSWLSGIRDSRLELPQDQTAHPAAQTRIAWMKAEALI